MEEKVWYKSVGTVGALLTKIVGIAGVIYGFEADPDFLNQSAIVLVGAVTTVTGGMALYGRVKAKKAVYFRKKKG